MSIIKLLAEFPNYSARKVRRLAKQISLLQDIPMPIGEGSGTVKGIIDDLMDYNLQSAQIESQLNDDISTAPSPESEALHSYMENWVELQKILGVQSHTEPAEILNRVRMMLTQPPPPKGRQEWWGMSMTLPDNLEEAHDWINDMLGQWKQVASNMGFKEFQDPEVIIERAKRANPDNQEHDHD